VGLPAHNLRDAEWYTKDKDELAQCLGAVFHAVRDENEWRTDKDDYHWGLYEGTGVGGVTLRSRKNMTYANATLPDNVCKMGVDTLTAKVATIRPIPQVLTSKGNWKDARRARKIRQLIQGEFFRHKIHEKHASKIIKDALVSRCGVVQVFVDGNAKLPTVERVHPWTLFVDEWDAEFGEPNAMFRLRTMDRRRAIKTLGKTAEQREAIKNAGYFSSSTRKVREEDRSSTVQRVELLEAWYRCQGHDDEDPDHVCEGRHVIICENMVLFDEPWPYDHFPFAILTYDDANTGFFGTGLVQSVEGYQVCIDDANEKHDEALMNSGKLVLLRDGSGVFETDIVDGVRVAHVRPGGYDPVVADLDLVNEHVRMRVPELLERAMNAMGVSQLAAQSKKPAGIESGIALQTLDDIESQRHIVFGRKFEAWCMDVARLLIEAIKKIAKRHGDYAVKVPMRGTYLDLKWNDVKVDGFQLEMQSVGQLYTTFAGRLDKLKTLFEMGAIDKGTFMRNLDAGDVQAELDLETVDRLTVDEMLESMLDSENDAPANDNDDYIAPTSNLPLAWAHKRAQQKLLQAQMERAPAHVLALIDRFIDDVEYLEDKEKATAMGPNGAPPVVDPNAPPPMPPGPPMPPPGGGMPLDPTMVPPIGLAPAGDIPMMPPLAA
jgi:hypothetical protein